MIIAVDFDGTIVEHEYPQIGKEIPFAIETLKKLQEDQHRLILWSVREGRLLEEAVEFCRERGLEFYAANKDFPEEHGRGKGYSRKLKADLFIDDLNLGGVPDWQLIFQMIMAEKPLRNYEVVYRSAFKVKEKAFLKRNFLLRFGALLADLK